MTGRYTPIRRLGSGGMGDVFLVREHGQDGVTRPVALKRIRAELVRDERFRQLFRHEVRVAIRLSHPNIVRVHDVSVSDDDFYLTMEYVHGRTLHDLLRRANRARYAIPIEVTLAVALDVARGLHYAHELRDEAGEPLGIVHRDLSPRNVLISFDGGAKILDFGVAKASFALDDREGTELKGKPVYPAGVLPDRFATGLPVYLAPEQARLETVDRRSDIYSLGITLWEMTTGQRLFPVDHPLEALERMTYGTIPSPGEFRPTPPGWEGVLRRALAFERADRYATARQLQLDVEEVARSAGHVVSNLPVVVTLAALFPEVALDVDLDPPRARRPALLVVDDEPDMRDLLTRALRAGHDVTAAGTVAEALAALAARPFDAVLSDERMPDGRGLDLLAQVARHSPRAVRVMITAYADPVLMLSAINHGHVDRFVVKPFRAADLVALVDDVLTHHPRLRPLDGGSLVEVGGPTEVDHPAAPSRVPLRGRFGRRASGTPGFQRAVETAALVPLVGALPWESLTHLADPAREDALSSVLVVGVSDQAIRQEEHAAIEWVLARRLPHYWLHVEDRELALLLPGMAPAVAATLAAELRDAAFGVLGARLSVAMAGILAGEDLPAVGRRLEIAAIDAWREENPLAG